MTDAGYVPNPRRRRAGLRLARLTRFACAAGGIDDTGQAVEGRIVGIADRAGGAGGRVVPYACCHVGPLVVEDKVQNVSLTLTSDKTKLQLGIFRYPCVAKKEHVLPEGYATIRTFAKRRRVKRHR